MTNLLLFLSKFVSYILVMVVVVAVAACGFALGRVLRKNKNKKLAAGTAGDGGASEA